VVLLDLDLLLIAVDNRLDLLLPGPLQLLLNIVQGARKLLLDRTIRKEDISHHGSLLREVQECLLPVWLLLLPCASSRGGRP
jgi:hypothetical protein